MFLRHKSSCLSGGEWGRRRNCISINITLAGDHRRGGAAQDVDGVRAPTWRTPSSTSSLYGSFLYPNLEDHPNYQPIWSISYPTQTRKRNPSPTPSAASSASSTPSHYSTGEKPSQFGEEKHRLPQSLLAAAPNKFGK